MKNRIINITLLFTSCSILSCGSINNLSFTDHKTQNQETKLNVSKITQSTPIPSATADQSLLEQTKPQKVDISQTKVIDMSIPKQELKPTFNDFPSEPSNSNEINIMYKDEYFVRVDKKANKIIRNDKFNYDLLMNLLNKYKLLNVRDASTGSQEEDDKIEKRTTEYYNTDIPNYSSMHYYEFPRGTNTNELCKLLRELPFVLTAYPKPTFMN